MLASAAYAQSVCHKKFQQHEHIGMVFEFWHLFSGGRKMLELITAVLACKYLSLPANMQLTFLVEAHH